TSRGHTFSSAYLLCLFFFNPFYQIVLLGSFLFD
ncbi:unnamed protein product, partial [Arabidopsis halleri]